MQLHWTGQTLADATQGIRDSSCVKRGLEDWNVCHRSGVVLSALLCAVCRGGVECKLHENRGEEETRGKTSWGLVHGRGRGRGGMDAKKRAKVFLGVLRQTENPFNWEKVLKEKPASCTKAKGGKIAPAAADHTSRTWVRPDSANNTPKTMWHF